MEILGHDRFPICIIAVALLATLAFSCCIAAEFHKGKATDIKLDGSLCYLPRSSAFGLGITALVCLSIAQVAGTSLGATFLRSSTFKLQPPSNKLQQPIIFLILLLVSWLSYGVAVIMLATASSMNNGQAYGKGWMNGDCYIVRDGVYVGAAVLVVIVLVFLFAYILATRSTLKATIYKSRPQR